MEEEEEEVEEQVAQELVGALSFAAPAATRTSAAASRSVSCGCVSSNGCASGEDTRRVSLQRGWAGCEFRKDVLALLVGWSRGVFFKIINRMRTGSGKQGRRFDYVLSRCCFCVCGRCHP